MKSYITRRLVGIIPMLIGISVISFIVIHLAPGGPVDVSTSLNIKVSLEAKEKLIKQYGLDKPIHIQYLSWLRRLMTLDFGSSYRDGRKVIIKIAERIPISLLINVLSIFIFSLLNVAIINPTIRFSAATRVTQFLEFIITFKYFFTKQPPSFKRYESNI